MTAVAVPVPLAAPALCIPKEIDLVSRRANRGREPRYVVARHQHREARKTTAAMAMEMPGTPPLSQLEARTTSGKSANAAGTPTASSSAGTPPRRAFKGCPQSEDAAQVIQRAVRCFRARCTRARLTSALGRPAEVMITGVEGLEMLCDFRDVTSIYCNVRIMKKPFGPFMCQFTSTHSTTVKRPTWDDVFFVPMVSSKCEIVVTLVGVTAMDKRRFLGQAVAPLETGWEQKRNEILAPLGKWNFPVDENLLGLHRYVMGSVQCVVAPLTARNTCISGLFQVPSAPALTRSSSLFGWTRKMVSSSSSSSPQNLAFPETPSASRKEMVTQWGVLTDTHLHLLHHSTAHHLMSLELSKLQLVCSSPGARVRPSKEPNQLYPVKIYCNGAMHVLYVTTYAQQQAWEYKIDLHRRHLLIP